jgi:hypothetical protein
MSAPNESNGRPNEPGANEGVLANLPHTRPQRSSPRRAAARKATAAADPAASTPSNTDEGAPESRPRGTARTARAASEQRTAKRPDGTRAGSLAQAPSARQAAETPNAGTTGKPAKGPRTAPKRAPSPTSDQMPRQGFESEMDRDRASGPVQPPGGAELVASAAEIIGELAKAGLSTGERLLRDALTHLPRP